jgi:hypothetical protein
MFEKNFKERQIKHLYCLKKEYGKITHTKVMIKSGQKLYSFVSMIITIEVGIAFIVDGHF